MAKMVGAATAPAFHPSFSTTGSVVFARRSLHRSPFPRLSYRNFLFASLAARTHDHPKESNSFLPVASRRRQKGELFTDHYDDDEEGLDEDGVDGRDEEGGGDMPFDKMRRWLRNKPVGFGEGKTYDVSMEAELMADFERSRRSQVATINKLQRRPVHAVALRKKHEMMKADIPSDVVRVRVENLPKKKNIHKDLQAAFKVFPGIININSAVSGSKKTRDPICKGFAFVDLKSKDAANRFIETYSRQTLLFGKVEKQISCRIITPRAFSGSNYDMLPVETQANKNGRVKKTGDAFVESGTNSSPLNFHEKNNGPFNENKKHETKSRKPLSSGQISERLHAEKYAGNDDPVLIPVERQTSTIKLKSLLSSSATDVRKEQPAARKQNMKSKQQMTSKANISGSSNRLKMKERSVLSSIFTKYGEKAAHLQ